MRTMHTCWLDTAAGVRVGSGLAEPLQTFVRDSGKAGFYVSFHLL
jgi:hypothetical protein